MGSSRRASEGVLKSLSPNPSGRFYGGSRSSGFASTTFTTTSNSSFINHHQHHHHQRAGSPTRVNLFSSASASSSSIRFSASSSRSMTAQPAQKKTCMCSPTNHPGSFRCSLHKNSKTATTSSAPYQSNRLFARRSAMTNSLVRIGTVEGDLVKRALAALIRPSSHHQRRRSNFMPVKTRFSHQ